MQYRKPRYYVNRTRGEMYMCIIRIMDGKVLKISESDERLRKVYERKHPLQRLFTYTVCTVYSKYTMHKRYTVYYKVFSNKQQAHNENR